MRLRWPLLVCLLTIALQTEARPVSYPGGWTMMFANNADRNSLHLHYSPTAKYSLGYRFEDFPDDGFSINLLQANFLLKRWNRRSSQANWYVKTGLGQASFDNNVLSKNETAYFIDMALDWETQRYFVAYDFRAYDLADQGDFQIQTAKVGVAPYIGDYGDLHTWLMLEIRDNSEADDHSLTALTRFFKGVHLVEVGIDNNDDLLLNWIMRY